MVLHPVTLIFFLVKMRATMLLYEKQLQQDQLPQLQLPIVLYLQYFLLPLHIYIYIYILISADVTSWFKKELKEDVALRSHKQGLIIPNPRLIASPWDVWHYEFP